METPASRARGSQRGRRPKTASNGSGAHLGFEDKLWAAADKLRGHMDASEYKHVVLGLIFLKYISDAFEERHEAVRHIPGADPEDRDEYTAERIFWVPEEARWSRIKDLAPQPTIGKALDKAMEAIERENPSLKSVLPKEGYGPFFIYFSTLSLVSRLRQRAHGSVFDTITRDTLAGLQVLIPAKGVAGDFDLLAGPLLRRILSNLQENETLSSIRDVLLPKLLSGEIRIKQAEKIVGEVA